jgi:hypothetical protein
MQLLRLITTGFRNLHQYPTKRQFRHIYLRYVAAEKLILRELRIQRDKAALPLA